MKPSRKSSTAETLEAAVATLNEGGVVLHATEGVWGFACDPENQAAVERVLAFKERPASKGLILIGADSEQFATLLSGLTPADRGRIESTWPGPTTWLVPNNGVPALVTGGQATAAIRVPGHRLSPIRPQRNGRKQGVAIRPI